MAFLGYELSLYTSKFVFNLDETYLVVARNYIIVGLFLFLPGSIWFVFRKNTSEQIKKIDTNFNFNLIPFVIVLLLCTVLFMVTYSATGYAPIFHHEMGAKYFQDVSDVYLTYRPYYTFAINLSVAALMSLLIVYFYINDVTKKRQVVALIVLFSILLVLTAKRGPILLPFAYLAVGMYLVGRVKVQYMLGFFSVLIFLAGILHLVFNQQDSFFVGMFDSVSNSFFVGVRELARFFTNFDGNYLSGLSYVASATSFIPTDSNEIKDLYLYPRYLIYLEGGNPDLSGGPRATYIGEAIANFGIFGFVILSWLFGVAFYFIFSVFLRSQFFRGNEIVYGYVGAFILHQFILAFFENGSAFLFHFMSKLMFVYALLYISNKNFKRYVFI